MIEIQKKCGGTSVGKKTLGEKFQKFGFTGKNWYCSNILQNKSKNNIATVIAY